MLAYYGSVLSENITETPEGFLICKNVPIARTGTQEYLPGEVGIDGDKLVVVHRHESEVFSPAAMASFEGKCVTQEHPACIFVDASNVTAYSKGHVQNVRRGTDTESEFLLADLFITDPELIRLIKAKELREVSCGYECEYARDNQGRLFQTRIRGNHVAVVTAGRAGSRVAIRDSVPQNKERGKTEMNKKPSMFARMFSGWARDAEPEEVANALDELMEGNPEATPAAAPADNAPSTASPAAPAAEGKQNNDVTLQMLALLQKISEKLDGAIASGAKPADAADPLAVLEQEITGETPAAQHDTDNGEAAVTVPAEELPEHASDEEPAEEQEKAASSADSAALLAAIGAIKPIIAKLPEGERKAAADAAAQQIRVAMGKSAKSVSDGYSSINRVKKSAIGDSVRKVKQNDDGELGRRIMARYNPHYKKEDK